MKATARTLEGMLDDGGGGAVIIPATLRMTEGALLTQGGGKEGGMRKAEAGNGHNGPQQRWDAGEVRNGGGMQPCTSIRSAECLQAGTVLLRKKGGEGRGRSEKRETLLEDRLLEEAETLGEERAPGRGGQSGRQGR